MNRYLNSLRIAILCVALFSIQGCQTREILSIQRGMTEEQVKGVFGKPTRIVAGGTKSETVWYYYSYMAYPHREWVYVPRGGMHRGGDLQQIQTSSGVRYPKFKIVFTNSAVASASELAPPDI